MWWMYVIIVLVLAAGIYGFARLVRFQTKWMTRRTSRTAESMYDSYADSPRGRHGRLHGGRKNGSGAGTPSGRTGNTAP